MASDASIEMPGDESSTSGGETKMAANDLSNFVVERDACILEVKELDIKNRIEDEEDKFAEVQRKMERRRQDEDGQLQRQRQDEELKLRKAAREKKWTFEKESLALQESLLEEEVRSRGCD